MSEYIIYWDGIGSQLTDMLREHVPPYLWPKRIRQERLREKIVRCRDCVFFTADVSTVDERGEQIATGNLCEWTELWTEPDGFCSWGERRTDDN